MKVISEEITMQTNCCNDLVDITDQLKKILASTNLKRGILTIFIVGSTGAITTLEYEPGLIKDMQELYERLAPINKHYHHDDTWGDANGYSHVRASIQGSSLTVPFDDGRMTLGTWQQIVAINFDNKPRRRTIAINIIGE
ncbi:MAG: YjbQ family protein [Nitrospirae bacterium]|nr:YjbQ family protein [Nitrospirota bacterium]